MAHDEGEMMTTKIGFLAVRALTEEEFQKRLDEAAEKINDMDGSVMWTDMPAANNIVITYQYDEDDGEKVDRLCGFQ